jgi:hypothetical protein
MPGLLLCGRHGARPGRGATGGVVGRAAASRPGAAHRINGPAGREIAATMTGTEAATFGLAAALAVGAIVFRAALTTRTAVVLLTLAAAGFLLALLHWGR